MHQGDGCNGQAYNEPAMLIDLIAGRQPKHLFGNMFRKDTRVTRALAGRAAA